MPLQFQSTLPARGATERKIYCESPACISIHAPRTGSDSPGFARRLTATVFQSTLPARGATTWGAKKYASQDISIHAPRTGSDSANSTGKKPQNYFNPRSPHGERQPCGCHIHVGQAISIHAPRTGSDDLYNDLVALVNISIHAPRTGSDGGHRDGAAARPHFNPRSPHGERLFTVALDILNRIFQSTLPARGATAYLLPYLPE